MTNISQKNGLILNSDALSTTYLKVTPVNAILNDESGNNIYSAESLKNITYLIDLNELKSNYSSNYQTKKSIESIVLNQANKSSYELSSHHNLVAKDETSENNPYNILTKNKIEIHSNFGCFRSCFGIVHFFISFLQCCSSCCFRPCCSTAAILGGFGAISGLVVGLVMMCILGILPVPPEVTKNICSIERDNFQNNPTLYNFTNSIFPLGEFKISNKIKLE